MSMMDASRVAGEVIAQAERNEEAAFNAQHALAREAELAGGRLREVVQAAHQRLENEQARAARTNPDAARFDPEDIDSGEYTPPAPTQARRSYVEESDDVEPPASWLT